MGSINEGKRNKERIKDNIFDKENLVYIQFFGNIFKLYLEEIEDIDNNLDKLYSLIIKKFNFKKINRDRIALFYRELNGLSFKRINSENIKNLFRTNVFIKVKILPDIIPENEEDVKRLNSDLITSLEIENAIFDDQKLEEKFNMKENNIKSKYKNVDYSNTKLKCEKKNTYEEEMLILNLLSKIFETRGIKTLIEEDKEIGITSKKCLQNLSSGLSELKKYEFHFQTFNNSLFYNPEEYFFFTEELRFNLSKSLNITPENIIFGPPKKGSIKVPIVFMKESIKKLKFEEIQNSNLFFEDLLEINKLPLFEYIQLDRNIFDSRFNNKDDKKWGQNENRGKEKYIPPKGWMGFGLNVEDNYDDGQACWLCFGGIYENEFAVAYYPITEEDDDIFLEYEIENFKDFEYKNLISNSIDSRSGERTGEGTILYQNIELAEKQSSLIDTEKFSFKLVLMCRVNPYKIRAPRDYKEIWVLNRNSEEVRPYRILVKLYPKNYFENTPKNFYQFYNFTKIFSQCLTFKDESLIKDYEDTRFSPSEYPINLYSRNARFLKEYLLFKRIDDNYT